MSVDNRYRQYTVTVPSSVARDIKATAKVKQVSECVLLGDMLAIGSAIMAGASIYHKRPDGSYVLVNQGATDTILGPGAA